MGNSSNKRGSRESEEEENKDGDLRLEDQYLAKFEESFKSFIVAREAAIVNQIKEFEQRKENEIGEVQNLITQEQGQIENTKEKKEKKKKRKAAKKSPMKSKSKEPLNPGKLSDKKPPVNLQRMGTKKEIEVSNLFTQIEHIMDDK
jgi:hypothetical protein